MKNFITFLLVIGIVQSCSNGDDNIDDNLEEIVRLDSWDIQIAQKEQFDNELYARIINPDYQFSLFSDFIDGENRINAFHYTSNGGEL